MTADGLPASNPATSPPTRGESVTGLLLIALLFGQLNFPLLTPQGALGLFLGLGFFAALARPKPGMRRPWIWIEALAAGIGIVTCAYVAWQSEPWLGGVLGSRSGAETVADRVAAALLVPSVILLAWTRIGWPLAVLAMVAMAYALAGPTLPDWLLPHRGTPPDRLFNQLGLHEQGVFGVAISVMFGTVALFVFLGVLLQECGAIRFMIDLARRWFGNTPGGMAKIAVVSSGLMGSLSGSAVANTAATGTFSIPLMRASGFTGTQAAAFEAVASSGGALVPPVMGAAAYLMLEIIQPPTTLLQVMRAAIIPAILYYLSLFLIVDFSARKRQAESGQSGGASVELPQTGGSPFAGFVFLAALGTLTACLLLGYSPARSATWASASGLLLACLHPGTRPTVRRLFAAAGGFVRDLAPLIFASACAGILIGVITMTGAGTRFAGIILPLMDENLAAALVALMAVSLLLGLGLPPLVCYLLMTSLLGPVIAKLGVPPLAAHFFIFYFGMLSMITPPVALAAYAAAGIAGSPPMATGIQAFRFGAITFLIPFVFVFRPQLLLLEGSGAEWGLGVWSVFCAVAGIAAFASAVTGFAWDRLRRWECWVLIGGAAVVMLPPPPWLMVGNLPVGDLLGLLTAGGIALRSFLRSRHLTPGTSG